MLLPLQRLLTRFTFWSGFSASCRADANTVLHGGCLQLSLQHAVTCRVRHRHGRAGSRAAAAGSDKALQLRRHIRA